MLFDTCDVLEDCTDCFSEHVRCFPAQCNATVEGAIGDNLVAVLGDVPDALECEEECRLRPACNFYTYYAPNSPSLDSTCFLLSSIEEPIQQCEDCVSGTPDCLSSLCGFLGGNSFEKLLLVFQI